MARSKAAAKTKDLGALPEWDLGDLYAGPEAPELKSDLDRAATDADAFRDRYQGKLASLSGDELGAAIAIYERLGETFGRAMSFASLYYAANMEDPARGRFYQNIQERINAISTATLFFTLELNRIEDAALEDKLKSPALAHYRPWLRDVRAFRPHQLSDEIEKLLHEKSVAGAGAWQRLFDETEAALRFPIDRKELTGAEALHLLSDSDGKVRKKAAKAIGKVFGDNVRVFAQITNTLAKDKEVEDRWRHFARPISSRNLSNYVEDEVVDALIAAVRQSYPRLSHRYYRLKAKWFGVEALDYWDRNAPLPDAEDRTIPWPQAEQIVLDAYAAFSPDLAAVGKRFFDARWIDAPTRPGKSPVDLPGEARRRRDRAPGRVRPGLAGHRGLLPGLHPAVPGGGPPGWRRAVRGPAVGHPLRGCQPRPDVLHRGAARRVPGRTDPADHPGRPGRGGRDAGRSGRAGLVPARVRGRQRRVPAPAAGPGDRRRPGGLARPVHDRQVRDALAGHGAPDGAAARPAVRRPDGHLPV